MLGERNGAEASRHGNAEKANWMDDVCEGLIALASNVLL
jgi:hypothetical protein